MAPRLLAAVVFFLTLASAFPHELLGLLSELESAGVPSVPAALQLSKNRTNCGPIPCGIFNAQDQFVSTTGKHAYASPAANQVRGPCPGLNAAANHNYISRSGVTTIPEAVTGLGELYGMGPDVAGFLAAYAVITGGDPPTGSWSIGGPVPSQPVIGGLLGGGEGISWSHNVYEGDASIARFDAYLNNGDAHSLSVSRFASAYATGMSGDSYTLDHFAQHFLENIQQSIATNPYYFAAPFSGPLVAPAAYNFVINFMSNHSASQPNGYLDGETFKSFFAVVGDYPNFSWLKGQERIPNNWYRRPSTVPYAIPNAFLDLAINFAAYPGSARLGGNTNGVNSYKGLDLSNVTGGVYHTSDLLNLQTSNARCFYAQLIQATIPDAVNPVFSLLSTILGLIKKYIKPIASGLDCEEIGKYDQTLFNQYPGYKYQPTGGDANYKL